MLWSCVGLGSIYERINRIESLRKLAHGEPMSEVPAVVQCDGRMKTITLLRQAKAVQVIHAAAYVKEIV